MDVAGGHYPAKTAENRSYSQKNKEAGVLSPLECFCISGPARTSPKGLNPTSFFNQVSQSLGTGMPQPENQGQKTDLDPAF